MILEEKKALAEFLAGKLSEAGVVYLTDFTGLSVESMNRLRSLMRAQGVQYVVAKNTLTRRALEGLDLPDIDEHLNGPTGLVFGGNDPVIPAKVVAEFAKEHEGRPVVKIGIVDRRTVSPDEVKALAALPPMETLLGSIAGSLTASVAGVVGVLNGLIRDIAVMVEEVAKRGEGA